MMAFESLSDKFQGILKKLKGQSRLTEQNMEEMLGEIRVALLEADVNYKVVKEFTSKVKEKAIGQEVFKQLSPSQMIVKIVYDEMVTLLGSGDSELNFAKIGPTVIMVCGLQGTGKTTTVAKIARLLKHKQHKKVLLAACDTYRPAAIDQLQTLATTVGVDLINMGVNVSPVEIAKKAYAEAKSKFYDVLIIDTAGRLEIDEPLMVELNQIEQAVSPNEVLLLVDAMSGQNAVNVANAFNERLKLTGLVMSKLDGDARGGSALSIKHLTGLPIKFAGVGEKIEDLEIFYPERMADRILGMGDIITLAEKAQENIDEKATKKAMNKMMDGTFDLDDMLAQMKQIQKLGSLGGLLRMIPGMPKISKEQTEMASKEMKLMETIINSMTFEERHKPDILKAQRKIRIAKGSGTQVSDINRMLKKFEQMREMMKQSKSMMKGGKLPPNFPGAGGFGGFGF
ncbi:MAG: signal recognition particle protein [Bacilli bacterium]|nr:signal recognition particle protein [Bacilli bacterium]